MFGPWWRMRNPFRFLSEVRAVKPAQSSQFKPRLEELEDRSAPAVFAFVSSGNLFVEGDAGHNRIEVLARAGQIEVLEKGVKIASFNQLAVTGQIIIDAKAGNDWVRIGKGITLSAVIDGGPGNDILIGGPAADTLAGGPGNDKIYGRGGNDTINGGPGRDILYGGKGDDVLIGGGGADTFYTGKGNDTIFGTSTAWGGNDRYVLGPGMNIDGFTGRSLGPDNPDPIVLTEDEVFCLLRRASAATSSEDAIIAVVDRGGRILGVLVEDQVSPTITGNLDLLVFAIDGAVAKARTAAFFATNQAPLTSRTVQFISQTTMTQREIESYPSITDPDSIWRGPGFVAPVGINSHFPPNVPYTPQVDLFAIEHTNRDGTFHPGNDRIKGTADDVPLPNRFNVPDAFIPAQILASGTQLAPPDSYGFASGIVSVLGAQSRGIATLPGGIPIYKQGVLVGGIGVFFPGETGFATEENSALNDPGFYDPTKRDRSMEAEYIAYAAVGGSRGRLGDIVGIPVGTLGGIPPCPGITPLPVGRIDLVGITLDLFGPGGTRGIQTLVAFGNAIGPGRVNGTLQQLLDPGPNNRIEPGIDPIDANSLLNGTPVPEGWLVLPHTIDGRLTPADVERIIRQGINEANITRAAIRLPVGVRTRMVFAVCDTDGNVLGLYRMPDSTVFSLDVAVAKARNVAYYSDAGSLQDIDRVPGLPRGVAFTNRTFRYLALPFFPEGIPETPPGPFSILRDGGVDPRTGAIVGPRLPASAFQTVQGYDAFNPQTNFRDPNNILNQNGIVFFPGSEPLYKSFNGGSLELVGGLGVSGDGVDQDDVVTFAATWGYKVGPPILRADQVFVAGIRLPYQKFLRNPHG